MPHDASERPLRRQFFVGSNLTSALTYRPELAFGISPPYDARTRVLARVLRQSGEFGAQKLLGTVGRGASSNSKSVTTAVGRTKFMSPM